MRVLRKALAIGVAVTSGPAFRERRRTVSLRAGGPARVSLIGVAARCGSFYPTGVAGWWECW